MSLKMESDVKEDLKSEIAWKVDEEDEERYNFSDEKGLWQPKPEDILSMFDQLSKGGVLPLQWTCPGRRAPETEQETKEETEMEVDKEESIEEELREPEPCAFDFDDTQSEPGVKAAPMRALGGPGRTPRIEKRVARMDNIMDSLRKQQIQRAAEREARKSKASPGRTPQGRGRLLKFGSPLAQNTKNVDSPEVKNAAPVLAITTTTSEASCIPQSQPSVVSSSSPNLSTSTTSLPIQSSTASSATSETLSVNTSTASNNQTLNLIPISEQGNPLDVVKKGDIGEGFHSSDFSTPTTTSVAKSDNDNNNPKPSDTTFLISATSYSQPVTQGDVKINSFFTNNSSPTLVTSYNPTTNSIIADQITSGNTTPMSSVSSSIVDNSSALPTILSTSVPVSSTSASSSTPLSSLPSYPQKPLSSTNSLDNPKPEITSTVSSQEFKSNTTPSSPTQTTATTLINTAPTTSSISTTIASKPVTEFSSVLAQSDEQKFDTASTSESSSAQDDKEQAQESS